MKGGLIKRHSYIGVVKQQAAAFFAAQAVKRIKAGEMKEDLALASIGISVQRAASLATKREQRRLGNSGRSYSSNGAREMSRRVRQMARGLIPKDQIMVLN